MDQNPDLPVACSHCDGDNLFVTEVSAGGGYAPNHLPQLGTFFGGSARFQIVVCADCGLTQFFAPRSAREKLEQASKWKRLQR